MSEKAKNATSRTHLKHLEIKTIDICGRSNSFLIIQANTNLIEQPGILNLRSNEPCFNFLPKIKTNQNL